MEKSEKLLKEINFYIIEILFVIAFFLSQLRNILFIVINLIFCILAIIIFTVIFIIKLKNLSRISGKNIQNSQQLLSRESTVKTIDNDKFDNFRGYRP